MAYYIRRGLVEENIETLEMIYDVIRSGREAAFHAPTSKKMNSIRHHYRRILTAAKRLPHEAGGKYKDLADRTEVSLDWDKMQVIVRPKDSAPELVPVLPDEADMIEMLRTYEGEAAQMKFCPTPDFSPSRFDSTIQKMGFKLAENVDTGEYISIPVDEDSGMVMMLAQRVKQKRKSDLLEQLGFSSRSDS